MAWDRDTKLFWNVAFLQPRIHNLDHWAVAASISRGQPGRLKRYHQRRQTFPLQLPLVEEQDEQTRLFGELRKSCKEDALTRRKQNDWILEESWRLIAHRASFAALAACAKQGGDVCTVKSVRRFAKVPSAQRGLGLKSSPHLWGGNVQEAFCHLKGWYQAASEMQGNSCFHTMERQTSESVVSRLVMYCTKVLMYHTMVLLAHLTKVRC
jgi:hypothetical protein